MNFMNFNLNLLKIFDALYTHRNGTIAAKKLRMAQPNISRALRDLRHQFDDMLFVRTSHGLSPTERANELAPLVRDMLQRAEFICSNRPFDLKNARERLIVGTTDYMEVMLSEGLTAIAAREAPKLTISFRPLVGHLPKEELERGEMDIAMAGYFGELPGGFYRQKLFEDPFVLVMRDQHPLKRRRRKVDISAMLDYSFVLISTRGDLVAAFDRKIEGMGHKRHIALAVPNSLSAIWSVLHSDHILIASEKFVRRVALRMPIAVMPLPIELDPIHMIQVWHQRTHEDPLRQWLRQKTFALINQNQRKSTRT
jgi:DNA-binding transcriptional LysR family regulator